MKLLSKTEVVTYTLELTEEERQDLIVAVMEARNERYSRLFDQMRVVPTDHPDLWPHIWSALMRLDNAKEGDELGT